jgi:hypothetical protein
MEFKDKADRVVNPGDLIVYGHNLGRCASLQYGKVVKVQMGSTHRGSQPVVKIRVQGVDSNWRSEVRLMNQSVLQFSERTLKVTRDQVPKFVLDLLDQVKVEE